jgi:hypothetical protein
MSDYNQDDYKQMVEEKETSNPMAEEIKSQGLGKATMLNLRITI